MTFNLRNIKSYRQIAGALALALLVGTPPLSARQNSQNQPNAPDQGEYAPPGQYGPNGQYEQGEGPQEQPPYQQDPPPYQQAQPPYQPPPQRLNLQAGTVITVRTTHFLSSDRSRTGDQFDAVLDRPVIVDGWVVARPGQTVLGRVAVAEKAKHGSDVSRLGLELTDLTLVDGQQLPLRTRLIQASGGTAYGRDAATIGATTITGAIIGGAVGRGEGAGIGAVAGAAAGMIGVMLTPGKPTVIPPETLLTFRQEAPLTISTARSAQAFQPVSQEDYDHYRGAPPDYRRQHVVAPPPPAPYYPYYGGHPYYWDYYPWGPYSYFGFGYGFGPRFFIGGYRGGFRGGFRGGVRGGFRR